MTDYKLAIRHLLLILQYYLTCLLANIAERIVALDICLVEIVLKWLNRLVAYFSLS